MKTFYSKKNKIMGFTLIELLVVIAIISILSSIVLSSLNSARMKGRDTRRKQDLHQIELALEIFYNTNGRYPLTGWLDGIQNPPTSPNPSNGDWSASPQVYWIPTLVGNSIPVAPRDPINIDSGPWCWSGSTSKNTIYVYISDGQKYVLCTWMENTSDRGTLQFRDVVNPWNTAEKLYANYGYSAYNYVIIKR